MIGVEVLKLSRRILALGALTACLVAVLTMAPTRVRAECELTQWDCYVPGYYYDFDPESCSCVCATYAHPPECSYPWAVDPIDCTCRCYDWFQCGG